ncbi:MAG: sulfite oxidase heme-binding subunit YedZ [Marinicellaceae bacterium]
MIIIKPILFIILLYPLMILVYWGFYDQIKLTADPIDFILHYTGLWSLRFLLLTLAMTPLRDLTHQIIFIKTRRMIGLFAFFYVSLHFLVYTWLDLELNISHLWEDIVERPYITVGFLSWLILVPLAVTSNKYMIKKLGRKWKKLHQWVYLVILLSCLHFLWLVKNDLLEPLIYSAIAILLLIYRFIKYKMR